MTTFLPHGTMALAECISCDFRACLATGHYTDLLVKRFAELAGDKAALEEELVRNDQLLAAGHPHAMLAAEALRALMQPSVQATIEAIRTFASKERGDPVTTKYFHLRPCGGCGAPMWQQPCQLCRFYPMGAATAEEIAGCKRLVPDPRASFTKAIERNGSIAVWFIRGWRDSVAWRDDSVFRRQLEELEVRAAEIPCADGGEIYDEILSAAGGK